jgi:hypothetical protein
MGHWDRSNLKVFLAETFRPRKLLAQKDARFAELHSDWLKDQEALRLSREAVAERDARLAELGAHWTKVLAEKDAELAQSREHWSEALRLSQEAIAQKDAHFAALAEHWTKVLAEKDAELAQSREHWSEALRLSQEAVAQKDAHLAELADHWTRVLAEKDAELARTHEHWSDALRLSEAALAEKNGELARLRGGDWTTPEGRAYRAGLKGLRTQFPWVGVFGPLKSASTFVWVALARLLNAERLVFNINDPQDGTQLMHELDPIRMRDRRLQERSVVFRMHVTASQHTLFQIRDLLIPAIVCTRDVFDCLVSLREELVKQWSHSQHMQNTRERGTLETFVGTVPIQMIEHFMHAEPDRQIDMIIELAAFWYLRFYQSWCRAKERHPDLIYVCRYEHLATASEAAMKEIMTFLERPMDDNAISTVVSALMQDHAEANFNVGISGRGRQIMSGAQIDRVISIARAAGAEDLVAGF